MAALDFPSSPTTNQVYTANGRSWTWDGVTWVGVTTSSSGGASVVAKADHQFLSTTAY